MSAKQRNLEVILVGWIDALRRGDLTTVAEHLDPQVWWQGVREDLHCDDRDAVIAQLRDEVGALADVEGIELIAGDDVVVLGVHSPALQEVAGERLHRQIWEVFAIEDGMVRRIDEFAMRAEALAAAGVSPPGG
jgi:hypothetical protein